MGIFAAVGVLLPFPYYYWLWTNPQAWVNLCGPSLALVSSSTSGYTNCLVKLVLTMAYALGRVSTWNQRRIQLLEQSQSLDYKSGNSTMQ